MGPLSPSDDEFAWAVGREVRESIRSLQLLAQTLEGEDDRLLVDRLVLRVGLEAQRLA